MHGPMNVKLTSGLSRRAPHHGIKTSLFHFTPDYADYHTMFPSFCAFFQNFTKRRVYMADGLGQACKDASGQLFRY